jgi:hypothetical protein
MYRVNAAHHGPGRPAMKDGRARVGERPGWGEVRRRDGTVIKQ